MAFNLSSISKAGTRKSPPVRKVIYGTAGVGKTTFATRAPNSIVIPVEDGLAAISDVDAFPLAKSFDDVLDAIGTLVAEDHGYQNVVLDSADWCEKLM